MRVLTSAEYEPARMFSDEQGTDPDSLITDVDPTETVLVARVQLAIMACQPGGRIVLVGMGQDDMTLPMSLASIREIDVIGSFRYCNTVCAGVKGMTFRLRRGIQ